MAESRAFSDALAFGKDGEHRIAKALLRRGHCVVPLYQYVNHDKAPIALCPTDGSTVRALVLPDLTVWSLNGVVRFVEVKRKQKWVTFKEYRETGFNDRLFRQYLELQQRTGTPIYVFFLHEVEEPTGVFYGSIAEMAPLVRVWDGTVRKFTTSAHEPLVLRPVTKQITQPLALFPETTLRRLWTLEELNALVSAAA